MIKEFYNKYIELNLRDFFEIEFDFEINKVLFFAFVGLAIACIITNYIESGISVAIKRLLRTECHSEETARTLKELKLDKTKSVTLSLKKQSGASSKIIRIAGQKLLTYEEYIAEDKRLTEERKKKRKEKLKSIFSFFTKKKSDKSLESNTDSTTSEETENSTGDDTKDSVVENRYYIPEDMIDNAKRYVERRSPTVGKTVLSCVLIMAFYLVLAYLMPSFIDLIITLT